MLKISARAHAMRPYKKTVILYFSHPFNKRGSQEVRTMPHKILIVEDNKNNASLLRDILSFHGYEIAEASDGNLGVALARELMPDLILMDIQMPGMDGMTAGGILKGDPATSRLKIIALTSFAMRGDRDKFLAAGFDGYLSKPINTRELPGLVKQWLNTEVSS
jgi:two-component system, cell cycle response regulator DivK